MPPRACGRCTAASIACDYSGGERPRSSHERESRSTRTRSASPQRIILTDIPPIHQPSPVDMSQENDWLSMFGFDAPSLQQPDWIMPDFANGGSLLDVLNTHAPNTPSWDILDFTIPDIELPTGPSPEILHGAPHEIPDGQPYDSPWVSFTRKIR
jgi:hypothetical protein